MPITIPTDKGTYQVASPDELEELKRYIDSAISNLSGSFSREISSLQSRVDSLDGAVTMLKGELSNSVQYAGQMVEALDALGSSESDQRSQLVNLIRDFASSVETLLQGIQTTLNGLSTGFKDVTDAQGELADELAVRFGDIVEQVVQMQVNYEDGQRTMIKQMDNLAEKRRETANEEQGFLQQAIDKQEMITDMTERVSLTAKSLNETLEEYSNQSQQRARLRETVEAEQLLHEGQLALRAGHAMEAYEKFDHADKLLKQGDVRGLLSMAAAMGQYGDVERTEQLYKQSLADTGAETELSARLALSRFYIREKRFDEGLEVLSESEELYPSSAPVQKLLGVALYHTDKLEEAILHLRNAESLNPNDTELKALLSRLGEADYDIPQEVLELQ